MINDDESFTVRGRKFYNAQDCATTFGVGIKHVKRLLKAGRADQLGLGSNRKGCKHKPHKNAMRVKVGDVVYSSVRECAAVYGVTTNHIYATLSKGLSLDTLGNGKGYKPPGNPNYGGGRSKPVKVGWLEFPSVAAASRAIGWKNKRLEQCLRKGKDRAHENLYRALLEYESKLPYRGDCKTTEEVVETKEKAK